MRSISVHRILVRGTPALLLPRGVVGFSAFRCASMEVSGMGLLTSQTNKIASPTRLFPRQCALFSSSGDGGDLYDDWYADFDPSVYEPYNNNNNNNDDMKNTFDNNSSNGYRNKGRSGGDTRSRDGGRGGRSYGYTRDTSRDNSSVDEAAVERLLEERSDAKRRRDYDTADAIRDQLMQDFAVGVFDKDRTWRTGCSPSGSGMKGAGRRSPGGPGPRSTDRDGPRRPPQDFGPNGHDYQLSPDAGPNKSELQETEIHELLADRLRAKLSRNYGLADELQSQLLGAGVYVHDGIKEWRADGLPFGDIRRSDGRPGRTAGSRMDRNQPYQQSKYSEDPEGMEVSLVDKILEERLKFKINRDFEKADAILEGLMTKHNIHVDDRLREWSVGGDFGKVHNEQRQQSQAMKTRGYVQSPASSKLSAEDEQYITSKMEERSSAKKERNFETADAIRDELEEKFNVSIDDRKKMWSVGGDFGEGLPRGRRPDKAESAGSLHLDAELDSILDEDDGATEALENVIGASIPVEDDISQAASSGISDSNADISSLKVPELKERLRDAGLPVSGNKADLIERLLDAQQN